MEDGVAILKVGPALTFALRECLFGLESIERELLQGRAGVELSGLTAALDVAMLAEPSHWKAWYPGDAEQQRRARRYSFSDRCRYYWNVPPVKASSERLMRNLARVEIPLTLLSQFLPLQYAAVREGRLAPLPADLARESVRIVLEAYSRAAQGDAPRDGARAEDRTLGDPGSGDAAGGRDPSWPR